VTIKAAEVNAAKLNVTHPGESARSARSPASHRSTSDAVRPSSALHEGHLAIVEPPTSAGFGGVGRYRHPPPPTRCNRTPTRIWMIPADPRRDLALCACEGVEICLHPSAVAMIPDGRRDPRCTPARSDPSSRGGPAHTFRRHDDVVCKLLQIVGPTESYRRAARRKSANWSGSPDGREPQHRC